MKKILAGIILLCLPVCFCGCTALVAGTAAGAGTAFWIQGKVIEQVEASFEDAAAAVKEALLELDLKITKETRTEKVVQYKGLYTDGRVFWVDVHLVSSDFSRIEVRVGAKGDEVAAGKVLSRIKKLL